MHLFHKYEKVLTKMATMCFPGGILRGPAEEKVIAEIQICKKCGKERGIIYFQNGNTQNIHPDYIRHSC